MKYPSRFADYILLERLGSGGMSDVELARKVSEESGFLRFVVIKRIKTDKSTDPGFIRMFKDEARITAELHHANIGTVYDFGREGNDYYLALEYVAGIDIRYLVNVLRERGQRVPIKVAIGILVGVLNALQYAHNKKDTFGRAMEIVHRDVNPRNIMLSIRGEIKLIDFGVAKAADRLERTRTDHVKGKFSYMAPEQISGQAIDHRADLYAVGLTLHELLAGHSPFYGLNQIQIMHRMVAGKIPDMPKVAELPDSSGLKAVHDKALAKNPDDRYSSGREFAKDLEKVADLVGGLPTDEQLASFLATIDPELTARIQAKVEAYATVEVTSSGQITGASELERIQSQSLGLEAAGTLTQDAYSTVTRTQVVGGAALALTTSMFAGATGILLILLLFLGVYIFNQEPGAPRSPSAPTLVSPPVVAPQPAVVPSTPKSADVKPVKVAEPEPKEKVEPKVSPEPKASPEPKVVAPKVVKAVPIKPVEPEPVEPEPVEPEPVEPKPAVPEPPPEPKVVVTATAQVTAPQRGLSILIDGKPTGRVTPARISVPLGTHSIQVKGFPAQSHTWDVKGQVKPVFFK